jgi:hypothetical protein
MSKREFGAPLGAVLGRPTTLSGTPRQAMTAWKMGLETVTVEVEASNSSKNSKGMPTLARSHKSARQLRSAGPRPTGDLHTVPVRAQHYRTASSIWCLCVRNDTRDYATLTSLRFAAGEDNGYEDEKEDLIPTETETDNEALETELSAEAQSGVRARCEVSYEEDTTTTVRASVHGVGTDDHKGPRR